MNGQKFSEISLCTIGAANSEETESWPSSGPWDGDAGNIQKENEVNPPNLNIQSSPNGKLSRLRETDSDGVGDQKGSEGWFQRCFIHCYGLFLRSQHSIPLNPSRRERLIHSLRCPPHGWVNAALFCVICFGLVWGFVWGADKSQASPGGLIFSLMILYILCSTAGRVVALVRLNPLIGMLVVGFVIGNVPAMKKIIVIDPKWSSTIRSISLVVILTRAGLGLDPDALRRLKSVVLRLGPLPTVVEALVCAVASHFILGFSWEFAFIQGFVLSAVSLAIVVPCMLSFQERGLGTDQGIPTLVMASSTVDNVLAIVSHAVLLGVVFSKGSLAWKILRGPVEVLVGLIYGVGVGAILWYLPSKDAEQLQGRRFLLLLSAALFAVFAGRGAGLPGAGALGCLVLAFMTGSGWRRRDSTADKATNRVPPMFARLWRFVEPFLFGLIAYEIDFRKVDGNTVALGISVLVIGVIARCATVLLVTMGAGFCFKERAFMAFAWVPKATVQAAIGSLAYDMAKELGLTHEQEIGLKILTIGVISIIVTTPLGAAAIELSANRFLRRTTPQDISESTYL